MAPRDDQDDIQTRIVRAADTIIRDGGAAKLTMRRLAEEAGVALKTPYNIYGSKTGVMIAVLNDAVAPLVAGLGHESDGFVVTDLLAILESTKTVFGQHEAYFRELFWAVMTSDHPEARAVAHGRITQIVIDRVAAAKKAGELGEHVVPDALGGQLGLNLLANMGSWAGGHLTIAEAMDHTKAVWVSLLLVVARADVRLELSQHLVSIQAVLGSPTS